MIIFDEPPPPDYAVAAAAAAAKMSTSIYLRIYLSETARQQTNAHAA